MIVNSRVHKLRWRIWRGAVLFLLFTFGRSDSKDMFEVHDLTFQGELLSYHAEDIDNDGLKDLLLVLSRPRGRFAKDRWLALYYQRPDGFSRVPAQNFVVPDPVILYDLGDVVGDPAKEFVYFGPDGLYYYVQEPPGFDLSPRKLFDSQSLFMLADTRTLSQWDFVSDWNQNGRDDILIPQFRKTEIHFRNDTNGHWQKTELSLGAEAVVSGYFHERYSVGRRSESRYGTPYLTLEDANADDRLDLLAVYRDSLLIFCQDEAGSFSDECRQKLPLNFGEIWKGQKIHRQRIGDKSERLFLKRIKDLNGDGVLDILSIRVSTKESIMEPSHQIRVHFGKRLADRSRLGIFFSPVPDQVIEPDGIHLVFDILDLNRDGREDLLAPVVKVGLRNIVRMLLTRSVQIEGEVYLMGENGLYPEEPSQVIKMVVNFSFRGGTTSPVYEIADFNGDNLMDVVTSIEEKRLVFFWGDHDDAFESHASDRYNILLPQNGELVQALDLNSDAKSDLIVTYQEDNSRHRDLTQTLRVLMAN